MIWLALIHSNISPCIHVSDVTEPRSIILYSIMAGLSLDLGRVISDEILMCANGAPSAALTHPSLVTHLCTLAGVDTSEGPTEKPRHAIDLRYIRQYCLRGAEVIPPPVIEPPPPPAPAPAPAPAAGSRREFLRQQFEQASKERAALLRGQLLLLECFRSMAEKFQPPVTLPSTDAFLSLVAWPGDQPIFEEGAGEQEAAAEDDRADAGAEPGVTDAEVAAAVPETVEVGDSSAGGADLEKERADVQPNVGEAIVEEVPVSAAVEEPPAVEEARHETEEPARAVVEKEAVHETEAANQPVEEIDAVVAAVVAAIDAEIEADARAEREESQDDQDEDNIGPEF